MKFKVGDPVEFDATVKGIFPQDDDLLIALQVSGYGRLSLHDRWIARNEAGPISEGESVTITGKVASIRGDLVSARVDGSTVIIAWDAKHMRRA